MKRIQFFQHRLQTLSALSDAVSAMRSLSAHHFRQARQALAAARSYRDEIESVIAEIGIHQRPHANLPAGMLVLASDLGLCGDYNSRLINLALSEARRFEMETLYSVGRRGRSTLAKELMPPYRVYDAPASLEGLSRLLMELARDILEDYGTMQIGSLQVVSAGFDGVGHFQTLSVRVLPVEPIDATQPFRRSPYADESELTLVAVREFLYITLYEVLLDALAAELGMRLMSTEAALEWLDGTTAATSRRLATARSEASTQELLDIVSGRRSCSLKQRQ